MYNNKSFFNSVFLVILLALALFNPFFAYAAYGLGARRPIERGKLPEPFNNAMCPNSFLAENLIHNEVCRINEDHSLNCDGRRAEVEAVAMSIESARIRHFEQYIKAREGVEEYIHKLMSSIILPTDIKDGEILRTAIMQIATLKHAIAIRKSVPNCVGMSLISQGMILIGNTNHYNLNMNYTGTIESQAHRFSYMSNKKILQAKPGETFGSFLRRLANSKNEILILDAWSCPIFYGTLPQYLQEFKEIQTTAFQNSLLLNVDTMPLVFPSLSSLPRQTGITLTQIWDSLKQEFIHYYGKNAIADIFPKHDEL